MFPRGLSRERLFCSRERIETGDGAVRPEGDRGEVAAHLARGARVRRAEPRSRRDRRAPPEDLRARDAPVPVGRAPHGPRPQLHARRGRRALPAPQRVRGHAADGIRRVRPARRERRDQGGRPPARRDRAQHRLDPRADGAHGLGDRLEPRPLVARARRTTAGRSGSSSASSRRASPTGRRRRSSGARTTRPSSRTSR